MAEKPPDRNAFDDLLSGYIEHFPDRSMRRLLRDPEYVKGLIEIIAINLAKLMDFSRLEPLSTSFIPRDLREREADILYRVPFETADKADEVIIHILIEHQSTVDELMGFRVLFYMMLVWDAQIRRWATDNVPASERRLSPILPIVLYTGDRRWNVPLTLEALMDLPRELERFIPRFAALLLSVKETAAATLTETDHLMGWLLTVQQKERASTPELRRALVNMLRHADTLPEGQAAQKHEAIFYILSLIMHRRSPEEREELIELVDRHTPNLEVDSMTRTIAQDLMERGMERGIEQGRQQGIEQGTRENAIKNIVAILTERFPNSDPGTAKQHLELILNTDRLTQLLITAMKTHSFDAFIQALDTDAK